MGELGLMMALWDTLTKTVTAVGVILIAFRMKRPRK
jgi:hypothetical protein